MILPVQTTFRNLRHSDAVIARVQEEADKLEKYFDRIISCRVFIEAARRHHRCGDPFFIPIELGVPGKELVATHEPTLHSAGENHCSGACGCHGHGKAEDFDVAIRDAFRGLRRQLKDYVSRSLRKETKTHLPSVLYQE